MNTIPRWLIVLILLSLLLSACSASPASPTRTAVPTKPPTSTPVSPTATPEPTDTPTVPPTATATQTPKPTNTAVPPTDTPEPTATLIKTAQPVPTKVVTPKPTATKTAAVPSGGVSSQPSTVQKSIDQSFSTAQAMVGLLDQMLNGGGVELCAPLIEKYQSIHNAPTYDVNGQAAEIQQAYGLYRQGHDLIDSRASTILGCGQGGGPIGGLELGLVRQAVSRAVGVLGQAQGVLKLAPGLVSLSPLEEAIARFLRSMEGIMGVVNQLLGTMQYGIRRQITVNAPLCIQVVAYHNAIPVFTMDPAGQSPSVQFAYQLYQEAVSLYNTEVSNFSKMCASGKVTITPNSGGDLHKKLVNILDKLYAARNALKQ